MFSDRIRNQNGSALLICLMLLGLLGLLAMSVADQTHTDIEMSFNQVHEDQAFYLAEAGLSRAIGELNDSVEWRDGFDREVMGDGFFTVIVTDSATDSTLDDTIMVLSTGGVQSAKSSIEALIGPEYYQPFRSAMFGKSLVDMRNSFTTDSYRSDSGSYAATWNDMDGDVGSNGIVDADNGTVVGGSVSTSLTDGLDINAGATINGTSTDEAPENPLVEIPQAEFDWAALNNDNLTGISGTYTYNTSTDAFKADDTVTFTSGVYYFSSITLTNTASIILAPGAEVVFYVTGDIELKNSSELNPTGDPNDLMIFSQGDFVLKNSGDMHVLFYNPNGDADLRNSGDFYGSIVADNIYAHNSAGFHYDRTLSDIEWDDIVGYDLLAWKETY